MDAQNKYRRIVIKVGSNVLTRDDGRPDTTRISALVDQVARLHRAGTEVILVSSGAVASGRSILEQRTGKLDSVSARQLFSAVGQVKLLNRYYDLFNEYGIVCGQVLTTKESLSTRRQYLNQRNCMETMLANGVLPIVNENDTISVTELMFTDNDELSGLVAAMMNAEALIILSNIDGIYDGSPADPASQVIRRVKPSEDLSQYIDPVRSSRGRGGMATKSRVSSRAAAEGIEVIIANGRRDGILTDLVLTGEDVESAKVMWQQSSTGGSSSPIVQLTLKESGKEAFSKATEQQKGKGTISIWLDNEMISNPQVSDHITDGIATISGIGDYAANLSLANLINSGALPFDIEVKSSGTINPTMGEKALDVMVIAGAIAFVLISLFMLLFSRPPGFVAIISLLGQVAGSIAAVSGYFGFLNSFTLTLPGIAGIILSIGMGVDANIITAERIKEEILAGKTIDGAIERGSKSSFWAIFDGNVTVIIVSIVLMGVFGPPNSFWGTILKPVLMWFPVSTTGSIYSFGYTLFAGIVFNFLMGVTASRLMLKSITRFKCMRKPWLLGGKRA